MKKLLKPASIAFYFLFAIIFFFFGMYLAKFTGAAKGQGLAGGAIVFGWGVMFGGIAFIASFFIVRYVLHKWVVRLNWLLLIIVAVSYGLIHYNYLEREKAKEIQESNSEFKSVTPTSTSVLYDSNYQLHSVKNP